MSKLYLTLENGMVFEGEEFGAACGPGGVTGEIVFHTGMAGYLEALTDTRHDGQLVVQTFPLIGNYGVIPTDWEREGGEVTPRAYIVKEWCREPSNFRSEGALGAFLEARGVVGLCGVDTRRLTRAIRDEGPMNAAISRARGAADLAALKAHALTGAARRFAPTEPVTATPGGPVKFRVAAVDLGMNRSTCAALLDRGCELTRMPYGCPAADILGLKPDGVFLSEGPGDPADNAETVSMVRALLGAGLPLFGVGLGHQLLALASGLGILRMKQGHRGGNLPARHLPSGKIYITSQSHGHAVDAGGLTPALGAELFVNVNDGSNEGIEYAGKPAFSVQFTPESRGGPQDASFLYDRFINDMEEAHAKG